MQRSKVGEAEQGRVRARRSLGGEGTVSHSCPLFTVQCVHCTEKKKRQ
jgi:hypothetical protein